MVLCDLFLFVGLSLFFSPLWLPFLKESEAGGEIGKRWEKRRKRKDIASALPPFLFFFISLHTRGKGKRSPLCCWTNKWRRRRRRRRRRPSPARRGVFTPTPEERKGGAAKKGVWRWRYQVVSKRKFAKLACREGWVWLEKEMKGFPVSIPHPFIFGESLGREGGSLFLPFFDSLFGPLQCVLYAAREAEG